jgi:hypothetical protein
MEPFHDYGYAGIDLPLVLPISFQTIFPETPCLSSARLRDIRE